MGTREFVRDSQSGWPFITEVASIGALVQAYPGGIFLTPNLGGPSGQSTIASTR